MKLVDKFVSWLCPPLVKGLYLYSAFLVVLTTQSALTLHATFTYTLIWYVLASAFIYARIHRWTHRFNNMGFGVLPKDVEPPTFRLAGDFSSWSLPADYISFRWKPITAWCFIIFCLLIAASSSLAVICGVIMSFCTLTMDDKSSESRRFFMVISAANCCWE